MHIVPCLSLAVALGVSSVASGQLSSFSLSASHDIADGPGAYPFPGFNDGFRQQIIISASRLMGLKGKFLRGIWIRRDLHDRDQLTGGLIDLQVSMAVSANAPDRASPVFALNAPRLSTAFSGRVAVPTSPRLGLAPIPWSTANSVRIVFSTAYLYSGGDLCIDVSARPVKGSAPQSWFIDYERGSYSGGSIPFGVSCSVFANTDGFTLSAHDDWLQIGSTMRLISFGRPGSSPLLLLGATGIPAGIDLSSMGATGCRQYLSYFLITRLRYTVQPNPKRPASLHFETQIPNSSSLSGLSVFTQFLDDETGLPLTQRTNATGLTTSNGLELKISAAKPDLGMAIVTSTEVTATTAMPGSGRVDVSMGPILRLLY